MDKQLHPDAPLIEKLGGPTKVAKRLGLTPQRVQNWMSRGIPWEIKAKHAALLRKAARSIDVSARPSEEQAEVSHG